ncbi:MAG TPA: RNA polymerase sigma factor [Planctomycetota bacterium]|nr:RNA polymerase sigma factor [Planctomycetota bacterium]
MVPEEITDIELMGRIGRDDRDAFTVLIRRHQHSLVNFFRRMGALHDEAEDLVQDTFLRVYSYRKRYRPTGKFTNFLYVLARHAWANLGRKALRTPRADETAVARTALASRTPLADARMDVQTALEALSEKLRAVVVLNVYQGLKYREIAEVLEIPLGTVKSRMHLALRQLKELLDVGEEPTE